MARYYNYETFSTQFEMFSAKQPYHCRAESNLAGNLDINLCDPPRQSFIHGQIKVKPRSQHANTVSVSKAALYERL